MKELSIEEKAKAYDNLIERLKDFQFEYRFSAFSDIIEEKFPELKKSEDERMIETIIGHLDRQKNYQTNTTNIEQCQDWLKSLKDRIQPQPKQEWKQENTGDLTDFENAMMHIGGSFFGNNAGLDPNDTNAIKEQANFLLELVPSKKWSEEDGDIRDNIIRDLKRLSGDMVSPNQTYQKEIQWLKSLRSQPQWKPSDEQMGVIEAVINNRSFQRRHLNSLYEQLKKLREE